MSRTTNRHVALIVKLASAHVEIDDLKARIRAAKRELLSAFAENMPYTHLKKMKPLLDLRRPLRGGKRGGR